MRARLAAQCIAALALIGTITTAPAQTPGIKLDVPFGPTSFSVVDTMLRIANVSARDFVIDLGSCDGRINIATTHRNRRTRPCRGLDHPTMIQ
jgi:hypothetical protein